MERSGITVLHGGVAESRCCMAGQRNHGVSRGDCGHPAKPHQQYSIKQNNTSNKETQ